MAKNIIIYSDGTGQRGGVNFDERRSNIYKLYRATRCGPDTSVDATRQVAYYDPGIGTAPPGLGFFGGLWLRLRNLVSQATGLGLTLNLTDCYIQILKFWEPGDRIYLFGFSRGAYTVRCLSTVLNLCGVPAKGLDGNPLKRDPASLRAIADIAVKRVYQHVSSPKDIKYLEQRKALAARFRDQYAARDADPYLIGVFDTVAAMASLESLIPLIAIALLVPALAVWFMASKLAWFSSGALLGYLYVQCALVGAIVLALLWTNLRYATGLPGYSFWQTLHIANWRMRFTNNFLSEQVMYARHALAIDENRASFQRVPWENKTLKSYDWLRQIWFAGDHSDIGGSYPENEARLSDISLDWMIRQVEELPEPLIIDKSLLRVSPDALGMQHDECKSSAVFRLGKKAIRTPPNEAPLHASVIERLRAPAVLQYDVISPYRPEALRQHDKAKEFYTN